eukprot:m.256019 g.256019  ORF g.256019 m.256019 type:complete len:1037 (+) comp17560_c0_seq5:934-4044(+)
MARVVSIFATLLFYVGQTTSISCPSGWRACYPSSPGKSGWSSWFATRNTNCGCGQLYAIIYASGNNPGIDCCKRETNECFTLSRVQRSGNYDFCYNCDNKAWGSCSCSTKRQSRCNNVYSKSCTPEQWSAWGTCSCSGRKQRSDTRCSGTGSTTCTPRLSWGAWGACGCNSQRTRSDSICNRQETDSCIGPTRVAWTGWGAWSTCTQACRGQQESTRQCQGVCAGTCTLGSQDSRSQACSTAIPTAWTQWQPVSPCDRGCNGQRTWQRNCSGECAVDDNACVLGSVEQDERACNTGVEASWSAWTAWSNCNVSCGTGYQQASRECQGTCPLEGRSAVCQLDTTESRDKECVVGNSDGWSIWSSWANCSTSCGSGLSQRDRNCTQKVDSDPVAPELAAKPCFSGLASVWQGFQPTNECRQPVARRWQRTCIRNCGSGCQGPAEELRNCSWTAMTADVTLSANSSSTISTLTSILALFVRVNETSSELRGLLLDTDSGRQEPVLGVLFGDVIVREREGLELEVDVGVIPELAASGYEAFGGSLGQCRVIEASANPLPGINEAVEVCVRPQNPVPTTTTATTSIASSTPAGKGSTDGSGSSSQAGLIAGVLCALVAIALVVAFAWRRRSQGRTKVSAGPTILMQDNPLYKVDETWQPPALAPDQPTNYKRLSTSTVDDSTEYGTADECLPPRYNSLVERSAPHTYSSLDTTAAVAKPMKEDYSNLMQRAQAQEYSSLDIDRGPVSATNQYNQLATAHFQDPYSESVVIAQAEYDQPNPPPAPAQVEAVTTHAEYDQPNPPPTSGNTTDQPPESRPQPEQPSSLQAYAQHRPGQYSVVVVSAARPRKGSVLQLQPGLDAPAPTTSSAQVEVYLRFVVAMVRSPDSQRAERWLRFQSATAGKFLLRPSSSGRQGQLALSYLKGDGTMAQERITVSVENGSSCSMLGQTFSCLSMLLGHFEHHSLPGGAVLSGAETYSDKYVQDSLQELDPSRMDVDEILRAASVVAERSCQGCSTAKRGLDVQELLYWYCPSWLEQAQTSL